MKPVKILHLTALMALLALVGAVPATAEPTQKCTSDPGAGSCGTTVTHTHETTLTTKKILIAGNGVHKSCSALKLTTVTTPLGAPLQEESKYTYSECSSGCTFEEIGGPYTTEILKLGHETADVTEEGEFHVNCVGLNCYFNGEGLLGTAKGPLLSTEANGEISIVEQELHKVKGLFCPNPTLLNVTTTPLSATYIGS